MNYSIVTLGCKVNQVESASLAKLLEARGFTPCPPGQPCEVCIINTCAVTGESARKSRQAVRRVLAHNPGAFVAVCGCWSQLCPEQAEALGAHLVSGSGERLDFVDALCRCVAAHTRCRLETQPRKRRLFEKLPAAPDPARTRAMLKVQDGCSNFCTYCVIPHVRGPIRSLPVADAAAEAAALAAQGIRELVVTGIEIASYGRDLHDGSDLPALLRAVSDAAPGVRLRLGSLEPRVITPETCAALAAIPALCPHFHLSLQSGCAATLHRMGRRYDPSRFYASVQLLRTHFPGCGLTADLIVGFPGETDAEFAETLAFIRRCAFSSMHIFPYSRRPGTPAATMDGQCSQAVKKQRAAQAAAVAQELEQAYLESQVGSTQTVLYEQGGRGHCGNYCLVSVPGGGPPNTFGRVRITGVDGCMLLGQPCN